MKTKSKCALLLTGCIIGCAEIFGLYIYFKGFQGATGEVKEENVKEVIESSSENSKGLVLDESFKGTIREGDNLNFKMGNLSYHRHVANLNHEQLMVSVSSSQTTYKLAIGISGGLLLLAAATAVCVFDAATVLLRHLPLLLLLALLLLSGHSARMRTLRQS